MTIPLPSAFWSLVDAFLKQKMITWAGQYDELVDALGTPRVVVAEYFNPEGNNLPLCVIRSVESDTESAEARFGDGLYHLSQIRYPYEFVVMNTFTTVDLAKAFCANAAIAWLDELRADPALGGLEPLNGERILRFDYDGTDIYVRGAGGQSPNEGNYVGTAIVHITIFTEV